MINNQTEYGGYHMIAWANRPIVVFVGLCLATSSVYAQGKRSWESHNIPRPTIEQWTYSRIKSNIWISELELTDSQIEKISKLYDSCKDELFRLRIGARMPNRPDRSKPEEMFQFNSQMVKIRQPAFDRMYEELASKIFLPHQIKRVEQLYRWRLLRDRRKAFMDFCDPEFFDLLGIEDKEQIDEIKSIATKNLREVTELRTIAKKSQVRDLRSQFTSSQLRRIEDSLKVDPAVKPNSVKFRPIYNFRALSIHRDHGFQRRYRIRFTMEELKELEKLRNDSAIKLNEMLAEYEEEKKESMPAISRLEWMADTMGNVYSRKLFDILGADRYTRVHSGCLAAMFRNAAEFDLLDFNSINNFAFVREFNIGPKQLKKIQEAFKKSKRDLEKGYSEHLARGYEELMDVLTADQKERFRKLFGDPPLTYAEKKKPAK